MTHLYAVTEREAARPRVVVVWTDEWDHEDFTAVVNVLTAQDYRVMNDVDTFPADEIPLRDWLCLMTSATHIALPHTWWTSATAHQLVQVAGWLAVKFIDYEGTTIPTASLKGA